MENNICRSHRWYALLLLLLLLLPPLLLLIIVVIDMPSSSSAVAPLFVEMKTLFYIIELSCQIGRNVGGIITSVTRRGKRRSF